MKKSTFQKLATEPERALDERAEAIAAEAAKRGFDARAHWGVYDNGCPYMSCSSCWQRFGRNRKAVTDRYEKGQ